jgi:hypothetical protein
MSWADAGRPELQLDDAIKLAFTDASKTLSELKSRQWTITNLSIVGLIGIATFGHDHCRWKSILTIFVIAIFICYLAIMYKCERNLAKARAILKVVGTALVPFSARNLFFIVDEGTIEWVAFVWVLIASVFAVINIRRWLG